MNLKTTIYTLQFLSRSKACLNSDLNDISVSDIFWMLM